MPLHPASRLLCAALLSAACGGVAERPVSPELPGPLVGHFVDDYGEERTVSSRRWTPHRGTALVVERWSVGEQWLLLRHPESALWTRVDWVELDDAEWRWAFCLTSWDQPSAAAALREGTGVADRTNPRVGCNGSPFTRMRTRWKGVEEVSGA
ncbi:hypothetical protein WI460_13975 [Gemmatimonadota bacterium Y43]